MTKVLITGVAGFIGSHVADHCLKLGFEVVGIDDLSGGFKENIPQGVQFRQGTITDAEWVAGLWKERDYDYVYHLAAYAAEGLSHFIKRFNYMNNLIGTVNLINAAVNYDVRRFVFTSSIAVYGAGQTPMTEDMTPVPEDPYGIAKLACEQELQTSQRMFGLEYTIFRPHNVYGEKQNIGDRYRNVVGIFINQILKGEPMTIFGDGLQQRAFTHVGDVVAAHAIVLHRRSQVDDRSDPERVTQNCTVVVGDEAQRVATVDEAGPQFPAVGGDMPAQIAEVAQCVEHVSQCVCGSRRAEGFSGECRVNIEVSPRPRSVAVVPADVARWGRRCPQTRRRRARRRPTGWWTGEASRSPTDGGERSSARSAKRVSERR